MGKKVDEPSSYDVGHGKPPVHSQFKKGQSGNPRGRPKGSLNLGTLVVKALRERVVINQQGRRRTITKAEAITMQVVNRSVSGDMGAFRQLVLLLNLGNDLQDTAIPSAVVSDEADRKVVRTMLQRLQASCDEEEDE